MSAYREYRQSRAMIFHVLRFFGGLGVIGAYVAALTLITQRWGVEGLAWAILAPLLVLWIVALLWFVLCGLWEMTR